MSEVGDDASTVVDSAEVLIHIEAVPECSCGIKDKLEYMRSEILQEINETKTIIDKLYGKLELINELLIPSDADIDDEDIDDDNFYD